jgi:hypothetical protein
LRNDTRHRRVSSAAVSEPQNERDRPGRRVELRPLGIGEIFDVGITIYRRNFRALLTLVFVVVAPIEIVSALIQSSAVPEGDGLITETPSGAIAGFGAAGMLSFLGATVATGACFKAVADGYLGERAEWRPALRFAARRLHSILWITILGAVLAALGLVLLVIPGIYLYIAFSVAVPVLLTEGTKGRRALGRSRRLVKGRWWGAFGVVALGAILVGIVSGALTGLAGAITGFDTSDPTLGSFLVNTGATVIASLVATPLTAAFITVLYFDLRVRKEAFDLQLLAEQIGVEPALGRTPAPLREGRLEDEDEGDGEQPPFWPPPPGWKPRSQRDAE